MSELMVIKVGGSLFDLPDLRSRLSAWLASHCRSRYLLIPGGGSTADVIRDWDRCHQTGESKAHWLALRALTLNAHLLQDLLPHAQICTVPNQLDLQPNHTAWILDAYGFAIQDETSDNPVPHSWDATSDTVAARAATVFGAESLVLLKSIPKPPGATWEKAGQLGIVDPYFAEHVYEMPFTVEVVCLRS